MSAVDVSLEALVKRAKSEIVEDVSTGRISFPAIKTFGDLHDFVDANEYGGVCDEAIVSALNATLPRLPEDKEHDGDCISTQATMRFCNALQDSVNEWIVNGGLAAALIVFHIHSCHPDVDAEVIKKRLEDADNENMPGYLVQVTMEHDIAALDPFEFQVGGKNSTMTPALAMLIRSHNKVCLT